MQGDRIHVDHVDVGPLSDFDDAAIGEPEQLRGVVRLLADDVLQRQLLAAVTIARPVRQEEGGIRRVTDHAAVRAAVGQPDHARGWVSISRIASWLPCE